MCPLFNFQRRSNYHFERRRTKRRVFLQFVIFLYLTACRILKFRMKFSVTLPVQTKSHWIYTYSACWAFCHSTLRTVSYQSRLWLAIYCGYISNAVCAASAHRLSVILGGIYMSCCEKARRATGRTVNDRRFLLRISRFFCYFIFALISV